MDNKCPFRNDRCEIWLDYEILRFEHSECNELLHMNWKEISRLYEKIDTLEKYIESIGGKIPMED